MSQNPCTLPQQCAQLPGIGICASSHPSHLGCGMRLLFALKLGSVLYFRPLLARRRIETVQTLFTYTLTDRKEEETS